MSTRQYFGTDGIRGRTGIPPITADFCLKLGWAAGQVLGEAGRGTVVIGQDPRLSGNLLTSALESGFIAAGLDVILLGVVPTPAVAYLTRILNAVAGVVVSASHNPYYDNGVKFFSHKGQKLPDSVEMAIEAALAQPMTTTATSQLGQTQSCQDSVMRYRDFCCQSFQSQQDLSDLHIVIDGANGATYQVAPAVFEQLGAKVTAIHCEPDGYNINADCGSTHPEALQKKVLDLKADLGIAFDGDGDRLIMIDHLGEIVDGDELLYMITMAYLARGALKGGVVGTQMTNLGLEKAFEANNIPFMRSKVGDRYVMDALVKMGWQLGGESSGHLICLDKTTTGDGIISALQVLQYLCEKGITLHEAKNGMQKCGQILLNVSVANARELLNHPRIQEMTHKVSKALENQGRILLRPSGTEPLMRIMVEGEDKQLIQSVAESMAAVVTDVAKQCS